jgi:hypothetical protein
MTQHERVAGIITSYVYGKRYYAFIEDNTKVIIYDARYLVVSELAP